MPRGLGDNPLKREKKLRRSSSRASRPGSSALTSDQNPTLPAGISGPGEAYASPSSTSYNDVFFHRRPEDPTPGAVAVPETIHEETHGEPAADTHVEAPVEAVPVEVAPVQHEPAPLAEVVPTETLSVPAPFPVEVAQTVTAVPVESASDHAPVSSPPAVVQAVTQPPAPAATTDEKKGFFGRIFGKWKKS